MKKTLIIFVILAPLTLSGCFFNSEKQQPPTPPTPPELAEPTGLRVLPPQESTTTEIIIQEAGIKLGYPDRYSITKSTEANRRGSFVSYNFTSRKNLPVLQEIQFFSQDSISKFIDDCVPDTPCFFGDYPDLDRYNRQKDALSNQASSSDYILQQINGYNYLVSSIDCTGDSCVIREYTTFVEDTKIDIWITMEDESQAQVSDSLISKIFLTKN